jgi:hypothetical protein
VFLFDVWEVLRRSLQLQTNADLSLLEKRPLLRICGGDWHMEDSSSLVCIRNWGRVDVLGDRGGLT